MISSKVIVPRHSGFCPGVRQAERRLYEYRARNPLARIYVLGELIHNRIYIEHLRTLDVVTVASAAEIPPGSVVVIRTHGLPRAEEQALRAANEVIDLTCFKVKQIQTAIEEHAREGYFVIINGTADHPETRSLCSYAQTSLVIEDGDGIERFAAAADGWSFSKALLISQTTADESLYSRCRERLQPIFERRGFELKTLDTICSVTTLRENEALDTLPAVDATFVVGDSASSNAKKLFKKLRARGTRVFFVQDVDELRSLPLEGCRSFQVVSSSSTPDFVEKQIVEYLCGLE